MGPSWGSRELGSSVSTLYLKKKILILFLIYLAALGLSGGMWALRSLLRHVRSLAVACKIELPHQGSNPSSLHWELKVLIIGPPEKSQIGII